MNRGNDRDDGGANAAEQTEHQQGDVFGDDHLLEGTGLETKRQHYGQFTAAFQHVAQHHDTQTGAAEQQSETAEDLEGAEVGVCAAFNCARRFVVRVSSRPLSRKPRVSVFEISSALPVGPSMRKD